MEFDKDENGDGGLTPKFGAIFMSNIATRRECIKRKLFGLPLALANFVKQVKPGMILFLFEFERRELYGVFQATSDGRMNIVPHAYSSSGKQFPAQVRMAPIWSCGPLPEVVFRDAIKDNYYSSKKFNFGLSKKQVRLLLELFYSTRLTNRMPQRQIANEITREAGNKRQHIDDRIMVTDTSEQETIDYIKSPTSNELPENTCDRVERVDDGRFFMGDKLDFITDSDVHWIKKRKINNDGWFSIHDDECFGNSDMVEDVCLEESCIKPDFSSDKKEAFRSGQNVMNFIESRQSEQLYSNLIKPDLESHIFALHDQLQHSSAFQSPNRSNSFPQTHLASADCAVVTRTVPYNPEFPDMDYQFSSHILDSLQDHISLHVSDENFLPLSTSEGVTHEAESLARCLNIYSGNDNNKFSFSSTCDNQNLHSQGTSNTILKAGYPETSESTTFIHKGDRGSLYSESSLARPSVFSRLSVALVNHKKGDDNDIDMVHDECDMLASVIEVMDSLYEARKRWVKGKDYRFRNRKEIEQPMLAKETAIDFNHLTDGDSNILLNETRFVDFKRRSSKKNNLDEMVTKDATWITGGMSSDDSGKTSVDARGEALVGRPGKSRKLIRPDFGKIECANESNSDETSTLYCRSPCDYRDDSTSCENASRSHAISDVTDVPHANNNGLTTCEDNARAEQTPECKVSRSLRKMCGASDIYQEGSDGMELLQDVKRFDEISEVPLGVMNQNVKNDMEIENQVKLSIQDLVSSFTSITSAQHSSSLSSDVTAVPPSELNQNVNNGLEIKNQVNLDDSRLC